MATQMHRYQDSERRKHFGRADLIPTNRSFVRSGKIKFGVRAENAGFNPEESSSQHVIQSGEQPLFPPRMLVQREGRRDYTPVVQSDDATKEERCHVPCCPGVRTPACLIIQRRGVGYTDYVHPLSPRERKKNKSPADAGVLDLGCVTLRDDPLCTSSAN